MLNKTKSGAGPWTMTIALLLSCTTLSVLPAAEKKRAKKKKRPQGVVLPADKADFAVQGEYAGDLTGEDGKKTKFGVQVIARSRGKFQAVGHRGGLPGAGWDRSKKTTADGVRQGDTVEFAGFLGGATIRNDAMAIRAADRKSSAVLKRVVRKSPTLGAKPPKNAMVLFDGAINDFDGKVTPDKLLEFGQYSNHKFEKDFLLHLEFRTPFKPQAWGQGRGNSGVYLLGRYEIQVLDTFGQEGRKDHCGAFYNDRPPDVNMCFPPGSWQTYDVEFKMAQFAGDGKMLSYPRVTVRHNGVIIHKDHELKRRRSVPRKGILHLQRHDRRVTHYRNIWVVE